MKTTAGHITIQIVSKENFGSIIIPEAYRKSEKFGLVIDVGEGCTVSEGDKVIYGSSAFQSYIENGNTYTCVPQENIIAVL
jgi:co-chaperonin GroES (HSP10)